MSRELFRLVGVWSGCWVVHAHKVQIVISCAFNKLVHFVGTIIV
jgi:hypothetical protein